MEQQKKQYRFVGSACMVGDIEFDQLGQRAQFTPELWHDICGANCTGAGAAFISEEDFQDIGFTQEEIDLYGLAGGFAEPSPEFVAKRDRAHELVRRYHAELV